jgi:predicted lipoprotein
MIRACLLRPVLTAMLLGAGSGLLAGLACGGGGNDLRPAVLEHIGHAVAVPAFTALRDRADALVHAMDTLCAAPDPGTLAAAQTAWSAERDAWSRVLPFNFGPLTPELRALDFWPVRAQTVESAVAAAPAEPDVAYVSGLGVSSRGLPALEYLLWGDGPDDPLVALRHPDDGPRRCAYARALAADIAARAETIRAAWDPGYADALATPGDVYPTVKAALDEVVNKEIDALLTMVKSKLDTPLGNLSGAAVDPDLLESRFAARSVADLQANLAGVWAVYHGADLDAPAAGLSVLVADLDPALDERVRAQYARVRETLAAIPDPISAALVDDRGAVQLARDELDTLRRMIKLDVASTLGVTLALSDNDGD